MSRNRALNIGTQFERLTDERLLALGIGAVPAALLVGVDGTDTSGKVLAEVAGAGPIFQLRLTLDEVSVTVANTTGASFGGVKLFDFAEGRLLVLGSTADLDFDWSGTAGDASGDEIVQTGSGDFALGTTISADATLGGTDVDLLPSSAMTDPFVAGVGRGVGALAASAQFDGTATAKDLNLNIIIDDADVEDTDSAPVLVSGTIIVTVINLGDYAAL